MSKHPLPVLMFRDDVISMEKAIELSGKCDRTIRNWCRDNGIGRKPSAVGRWEVSAPALEMRLNGDFESLELLRRGDRESPTVKRYIEHALNHRFAKL